MLANCGAEIYKPVVGDYVHYLKSELPVVEPLIVTQLNHK